jgi:hypothetical protein
VPNAAKTAKEAGEDTTVIVAKGHVIAATDRTEAPQVPVASHAQQVIILVFRVHVSCTGDDLRGLKRELRHDGQLQCAIASSRQSKMGTMFLACVTIASFIQIL